MLVPSSTWLQYNTSLSLGPRSFVKALLATLWPLLAFCSWPYKSAGLFPFPMEMAVVLFKYFPFCQYSPSWLILIEVSEWIHSPARLCLSELLQEDEAEEGILREQLSSVTAQLSSSTMLPEETFSAEVSYVLKRHWQMHHTEAGREMHHFGFYGTS